MNKGMAILKEIAKYKKRSLHEIGRLSGESRSMIYTRQDTDDIKVEVLKKYLKVLGCELIIQDRFSNAFWKI